MPLGRLTFDEAAKLIRAENETDLSNAQLDRMLAGQNGVKLRNGKVLKDVWAKGSLVAMKYDD